MTQLRFRRRRLRRRRLESCETSLVNVNGVYGEYHFYHGIYKSTLVMECYGASSCSLESSLGLHPVGTLKPAKWGWWPNTYWNFTNNKGDHLGHVSRYIRYMMGKMWTEPRFFSGKIHGVCRRMMDVPQWRPACEFGRPYVRNAHDLGGLGFKDISTTVFSNPQ